MKSTDNIAIDKIKTELSNNKIWRYFMAGTVVHVFDTTVCCVQN